MQTFLIELSSELSSIIFFSPETCYECANPEALTKKEPQEVPARARKPKDFMTFDGMRCVMSFYS